MKYILNLLFLILITTHSFAQLNSYEGEAIFLKMKDAKEKFVYQKKDTAKNPVGKYSWELKKQIEGNQWQLAILEAEFKANQLHGEFYWTDYLLDLSIAYFTKEEVNARATGFKTVVTGKYENGNPVGRWRIVKQHHGARNDTLQILTYEVNSGFWNARVDNQFFEGYTTKERYYSGLWKWRTADGVNYQTNFYNGIMTAVKINEESYDAAGLFEYVSQILEARDSIAAPPTKQSWVWDIGLSASDSLMKIQADYVQILEKSFQPIELLNQLLDQKANLQLPQLNGSKRFYYPLPKENIELLQQRQQKLELFDSLLAEQLQLPLFVLRRNTNENLQLLLNEAEELQTILSLHLETVKTLQKKETRYSSTRFLPDFNGQYYATHLAYVSALQLSADQNLYNAEDMLARLEAKKGVLREQGAVEELEMEWSKLITELQNEYMPDSTDRLGLFLYEKYVTEVFQFSMRKYSSLTQINEKREYLKSTIEYFQYYFTFFKNKQHQFLTKAPVVFADNYNVMLVNPFTGEANIPEVLKRRYLTKVQNELWPWQVETVKNSPSEAQFRLELAKAERLKKAIVDFATDTSKEAKRLENRLRRERDMQRFAESMLEYWDSVQE